MSTSMYSGNRHSPVYTKSIEISHLARHISSYLVHDLAHLERNGKEDPHVYITGDIIQQSISLGPEILKAENHPFQDEKHKYATSVQQLSNRLYNSCKRLQNSNSNGKDFLPLILNELRKFRKLQYTWRLTL